MNFNYKQVFSIPIKHSNNLSKQLFYRSIQNIFKSIFTADYQQRLIGLYICFITSNYRYKYFIYSYLLWFIAKEFYSKQSIKYKCSIPSICIGLFVVSKQILLGITQLQRINWMIVAFCLYRIVRAICFDETPSHKKMPFCLYIKSSSNLFVLNIDWRKNLSNSPSLKSFCLKFLRI